MRQLTAKTMILIMVLSAFMGITASASTTNPSSSIPVIAVDEDKPVVVYSGVQNTMTIQLENQSVYMAKNLVIVPDASETGVDGFRLLGSNFDLTDTQLIKDKPIKISLDVAIDDTVDEGIYPINLILDYDNMQRDHFTRTITTYFEVKNDIRYKEDIRVSQSNAESLRPVAGDYFTFDYSVMNSENYTAENVKTYITGLPSDYFAVVSTANKVLLGEMKQNVMKSVAIDYYLSDSVPTGSYPYEFVIEYENEEGNRIFRTQAYNLFVGEGQAKKGNLTVSATTYPSSIPQDKAFKVGFTITNNGEGPVEDAIIRMTDNPVFIPKSASVVKVDSLAEGESYTFSAEVVATGDGLQDRNYPVEFQISYDNGKETLTNSQIMGVYVDSKGSSGSDSGNAPKIIISEYRSDPQIVKAGGEFDLFLDFKNTNRSRTIYNVKAYITANDSTEDTGNVFTPVGSSNTFYIDEIGPKEASSQTIRLFTVPDAAPKTYNLTINFEYEDMDGNTYTATEFVGVPVTQVTKVESSDFNMPAEVMAGEGVNVYFDIFNTGKAKVYNLLVRAEGNFNSDPVTRYVGNFDAGNSDYFDTYVNFYEPGMVEGKFIISYDDAAGVETVIEKPFSVNVMEPFMPDFEMGEGEFVPDDMYPEPTGGLMGRLPMLIGVGLGLVALVVVIVLVLRRRKKKKMELMFDETD